MFAHAYRLPPVAKANNPALAVLFARLKVRLVLVPRFPLQPCGVCSAASISGLSSSPAFATMTGTSGRSVLSRRVLEVVGVAASVVGSSLAGSAGVDFGSGAAQVSLVNSSIPCKCEQYRLPVRMNNDRGSSKTCPNGTAAIAFPSPSPSSEAVIGGEGEVEET